MLTYPHHNASLYLGALSRAGSRAEAATYSLLPLPSLVMTLSEFPSHSLLSQARNALKSLEKVKNHSFEKFCTKARKWGINARWLNELLKQIRHWAC